MADACRYSPERRDSDETAANTWKMYVRTGEQSVSPWEASNKTCGDADRPEELPSCRLQIYGEHGRRRRAIGGAEHCFPKAGGAVTVR